MSLLRAAHTSRANAGRHRAAAAGGHSGGPCSGKSKGTSKRKVTKGGMPQGLTPSEREAWLAALNQEEREAWNALYG